MLVKILKRQIKPKDKMTICKQTIDTSNEFEVTRKAYDLLYEDLCKRFLI